MGSGSSPLGAGFEGSLFVPRSPWSGIEKGPVLEFSDWLLVSGFESLSLVLGRTLAGGQGTEDGGMGESPP